MQGRAQAICAGLLLALAFSAGWFVNGWRADARIARVEARDRLVRQDVARLRSRKWWGR